MKLLKDAYKDTKIICLANMMTTFDNGLQNAILEDITLFNNEFGKCAYFVSFDNNTSGGDGHPSLEGHKNAASCLKDIISNLDNEL